VAGGVLFLGVTQCQHGGEDAVDMPHVLEALGHVGEAGGQEWLHIFAQGGVATAEGQEGVHIVEGEAGGLGGTDETDHLERVPRIEAVVIGGTPCRLEEPHALIVTER